MFSMSIISHQIQTISLNTRPLWWIWWTLLCDICCQSDFFNVHKMVDFLLPFLHARFLSCLSQVYLLVTQCFGWISPFIDASRFREAISTLYVKLKHFDPFLLPFQVDLEHNHYRSFQGLTCLMQISTRTEDFIVDTLKLRKYLGDYLREFFRDPTKRKVQDVSFLYICTL